MTSTTHLLTVEEFGRLPETGPFYYELHKGELLQLTRPKFKHHVLQDRLVQWLRAAASGQGYASMEMAFRALPEYELRVADVAFISQERFAGMDPDDYLRGAPDLVIEVLSPSNTAVEINEKEKLCLENGCAAFWVVDPTLRQVKISTPCGITTTYRAGQQIPPHVFGGTLAVDAVFVAH